MGPIHRRAQPDTDDELDELMASCRRTTSRLCEQSAELRERHEDAEERTQRAFSTWRKTRVMEEADGPRG